MIRSRKYDIDQINLIKCFCVVLSLTILSGLMCQSFGIAAIVLFISRIAIPFFWKNKNPGTIKLNNVVFPYRDKIFTKTQRNIFIWQNIISFVSFFIATIYFTTNSNIVYFVPLLVSFLLSYAFQLYIKAPPFAFLTHDPNQPDIRRDPYIVNTNDSMFKDDPYRYGATSNWHPTNIYSHHNN